MRSKKIVKTKKMLEYDYIKALEKYYEVSQCIFNYKAIDKAYIAVERLMRKLNK